jgi:aspartate-semialdehyde dehydrogenase
MDVDVPLMVPEVNPEHQAMLAGGSARGIVTNPNSSTIGHTLALKPLVDRFGVEAVHVVTMQAISGAGLPGLSSYRILDNVIPFIAGEEEKLEHESGKILGTLRGDRIEPYPIRVSAQCNRVPVIDGHTLCVSVGLGRRARLEDVRRAFDEFSAEPQQRALPSAPRRPIHYRDQPDAPQPRLHRDLAGGMATVVGRLRPCPLMDWRFVVLSHNTLRGAARGAILVAEQIVARRANSD